MTMLAAAISGGAQAHLTMQFAPGSLAPSAGWWNKLNIVALATGSEPEWGIIALVNP